MDKTIQVITKFIHAILSGRLIDSLEKIKFNKMRSNFFKTAASQPDVDYSVYFENQTDKEIYCLIASLDYSHIVNIEMRLLLDGRYLLALKIHNIMISRIIRENKKSIFNNYLSFETFTKLSLYKFIFYKIFVQIYNRIFHRRFNDLVHKKKDCNIGAY